MNFSLVNCNALDAYDSWESPIVVISDGPYGVGGYEGDPSNEDDLPSLYEPHISVWTERASPQTVLWFWNTELGWATVHPVLKKHGWIYHGCNIWDKGINHIAGNCNGKTMRQFPVVTEVCVMYVRQPFFKQIEGGLSIQQWMRSEWERTGLPLYKANEACGVKNAATRKYLTQDHCFYPPPPEIFFKLSEYANSFGDKTGKPYFRMPKEIDINEKGWDRHWYQFNFEYGVSNVWTEKSLRGKERIKDGSKPLHLNQKPLALMERIIKATSKEGDVVWEPFGGLCSASLAAIRLKRKSYAAEINPKYYKYAKNRFDAEESLFEGICY